ncbi:MAG: DHH family phosphoesterase, partial [Nanoarchaeota archaeon]|nr:DHH family phosphoesterase [Nanoarchaeota archaeon]
GRIRNGDYKLSLRSAKRKVLPILHKALEGLKGFGGGHEHACGANVNEADFDEFLENIKKQLV